MITKEFNFTTMQRICVSDSGHHSHICMEVYLRTKFCGCTYCTSFMWIRAVSTAKHAITHITSSRNQIWNIGLQGANRESRPRTVDRRSQELKNEDWYQLIRWCWTCLWLVSDIDWLFFRSSLKRKFSKISPYPQWWVQNHQNQILTSYVFCRYVHASCLS